MKKTTKLTALLCAFLLLGSVGFGQVKAQWVKGKFTKVLKFNKQLLVKELSSAPSHTSGYGTVYVLSADNKFYYMNDSGTATELTTGNASGYTYGAETTATPSSAFTVDWSANHVQRVTITGTNIDVTFTNPSGPCRLWLVVVQGDGSDTIDWTNEADIIFPGAVDPVLSTSSGDIDLVTFIFDGVSYLGVANYDFD